MIRRALTLPPPGTETFFLWGPRQTGKTTLLRATYPEAFWVDLLQADTYRRYLEHPERLREELSALSPRPFVVIDEVQKVPALLDEVHWLHERWGVRFCLCGSSARKVRRGHANLLGGRALRYELHGLTYGDLGQDLDLDRLLGHGFLPRIYQSEQPHRLLSAYVGDYLKEEVAAEGLVRNLPAFSTFLTVAALSDAELVNFSTIARDCGVSSPTIKGYFEILEDTLLGAWLPAYRYRVKRRIIGAPKFYFRDVGIPNVLLRRRDLAPASEAYGKAFESWVVHELRTWNVYGARDAELAYWRLASGIEVDVVVDRMAVAIEAKATAKVTVDHLRGLRQLAVDHPQVRRRLVVCLEPRVRRTDDGIEIVPAREFARQLWTGEIF
jgi:predicted AAA+ superfamily ATPase